MPFIPHHAGRKLFFNPMHIVRMAREESIESTSKVLGEARSSAGAEADKVAKAGEGELSSIHNSGESRRKAAVDIILNSLTE